jgi:hypothetical protein
MLLRHLLLSSTLALSSFCAVADEDADFDLAAECAGISAAVEAAFPEPAAGSTSETKQLRQVAAEIHDSSYRTAYDLGAKAGVPLADVVKRMISAMVLGGQMPKNQLVSAMKLKCEKKFVRVSQRP